MKHLMSARRTAVRGSEAMEPASHLSLEVMRRDAKPMSHIEPVRRCAISGDSGVKMNAFATKTPSLISQPVQELLTVTRAPRRASQLDLANLDHAEGS